MGEEKYDNLIRAIELINVELQELSCHKNNNFLPEKKSNLDVGLKNEIVEQIHEGLDFTVHIQFNVVVFHSEADVQVEQDKIDDDDVLFNINFTLESTYKIDFSEVDHDLDVYKEELKLFSKRNVPINTWPYAREIISSTSTRMGFPPLIIPTNKNVAPL